MNLAGLRATFRIARRDAVRAKGRSILVVAMIGVPMLGLAFADVAVRTSQLPPAEVARREIGQADLVAELVSSGPVEQRGRFDYSTKEGRGEGPPAEAPDLGALLPPGSRVASWRTSYGVGIRAGERVAMGEVERVDLTEPFAEGLVRHREGTLPASPAEAVITPNLARSLRTGVGGTVRVGDTSFTVTGIVVEPSSLAGMKVYVRPDAPVGDEVGIGGAGSRRWAVTLPEGTRDTDLVVPLNQAGFAVNPRTWYFDPPPDPNASHFQATAETVGVTLVVVGLATLEIVLLAGTAFAVGARRKRRELGLVAATGGDRRDVRRIVLAGGVVLGSFAGLLGVLGGIAAVAWGAPALNRLSGSLQGPLDIRPLELGAIVAIGAGTALLATLMPARAASRQPVVAALTGRRGDVATRMRVPVVALAVVVIGAALAFWAAGDGQVPLANANGDPIPRGRPANFSLLLVGAVLAELGFVACAPALVGLVGRLASRLPLSLRLAARDAARHRTRSGPAVGAVVAAVAGSVAMSVYLSSDTERQRRAYQPTMPAGTVSLWADDAANPVSARDLDATVAALPVRDRVDIHDVGTACDTPTVPCPVWLLEAPPAYRCPARKTADPTCVRANGPNPGQVAVADSGFVTWLAGRDDPAVTRAMAGGAVAVFDSRWLQGGELVLREQVYSSDGTPVSSRRVALPAVLVERPEYTSAPPAVLTPETARANGLPMRRSATILTTTRVPTEGEEAAARGAITRTVSYAGLYVERGFRTDASLPLLALVLGAAFVTIGSTGIATGLAAADSRPDLATLAAVGAAPRVRRRLAMAQAATVAALGTGLGILAGLVPAIAVVGARAEFPLAMPWPALGAIAVGVPLLAALLVGAVTRSRLPLERRLA